MHSFTFILHCSHLQMFLLVYNSLYTLMTGGVCVLVHTFMNSSWMCVHTKVCVHTFMHGTCTICTPHATRLQVVDTSLWLTHTLTQHFKHCLRWILWCILHNTPCWNSASERSWCWCWAFCFSNMRGRLAARRKGRRLWRIIGPYWNP